MTPRKILIFAWLLCGAALVAYHFGPGQLGIRRDEAARQTANAASFQKDEHWPDAVAAYTDALAKLPLTERNLRWSLRFERARARTRAGELPDALCELDALLAEMRKADPASKMIEDVRAEIATSEYYAGWIMRLEGAPAEEWQAELESARDGFRSLAEEKTTGDGGLRKEYLENLEATIRLARLEPKALRAMSLPKFCQSSKDVAEKCRNRRERNLATKSAAAATDRTRAVSDLMPIGS
jgi:hypothetical protein